MSAHTLSHLAPPAFSPKYLRRVWDIIASDGAPREIRIPGIPTIAGVFLDGDEAARACREWDGKRSIYITPNPLKLESLSHTHTGALRPAAETAKDRDIARRAWLIVDPDPITTDPETGEAVKHVSATDKEQLRALETRDLMADWLSDTYAFPKPLRGHSGNGGRLLYGIALSNDKASTELIQRCLKALALRWDSASVTIDTSVYNAARIDKLWGTIAVKGTATADRPHRRSFLDVVPQQPMVVTTREQLEQLAALVPVEETPIRVASDDAGHDFPALLDAFKTRDLYIRAAGGGKHLVTCPWKQAHSGDGVPSETALFEPSTENNGGGFKCLHAHCTDRTIKDVYKLFIAPAPRLIIGDSETRDASTLMSIAQMEQRLGKHTEWLVDRMFAVGDMSLLASKPGVGKSTFAAQLAVAVAYGRPFLGRVTKQGLVVVLAFEGVKSTMAQMKRLGADPDDTSRILMWSAEANIKDPAAWLDQLLKDVAPALIIIDTLSDFARARHGASNAGYDEMMEKLGSVYRWAQAHRAHIHLLHHGAKGDREGIDSPLGTIANVGKPGTVLDYRPLSSEDGAPRVLRCLKHREGDPEDIPSIVLDFDRDRGLTVAGFRQDVAVRELGVAIIKVVAQTLDIKQAEVMAEVGGRKQAKLEALRLLTGQDTGVLVRTGTPGSRTFPFRLSVRPGLDDDPVEVWRKASGSLIRAGRFPQLRVGSPGPGTYSNRMDTGADRVGSRLIQTDRNLLKTTESEAERVGSPDYIGDAEEPGPGSMFERWQQAKQRV